jgi:hypothetical protein
MGTTVVETVRALKEFLVRAVSRRCIKTASRNLLSMCLLVGGTYVIGYGLVSVSDKPYAPIVTIVTFIVIGAAVWTAIDYR